MQIIQSSLSFNAWEGSGPRSMTSDITLPTAATQATAILTGFNAAFTPEDGDHHLGNLEIRLNTAFIISTLVRVTVVFGLRDWSGEWDDKYEGTINFAVVAE